MPLYALFLIPLVAVFALRHDRDGVTARHREAGTEREADRTHASSQTSRPPTNGISAPTGDALT